MNNDNKDYLQAFFKDHNYFQKDEKITQVTKKKDTINPSISSNLVDLKNIFNKNEVEKKKIIKSNKNDLTNILKKNSKKESILASSKKILNKLTPLLSFITPNFVFEKKKQYKYRRNNINYIYEIWVVNPDRIPNFTNKKELLSKCEQKVAEEDKIIKDLESRKEIYVKKTEKYLIKNKIFDKKYFYFISKYKKVAKCFLSNQANKFRLLFANYLVKYKNYKKLQKKLYIEKQKFLLEEKVKAKRIEDKLKKDLIKNTLEQNKKISFSNKKNIVKKGFFTKKNLKETVQVLGMVASVFVVGVVGLRLPALMSQYEFMWNADFFYEQQKSVEFLVDKKDVFKDIQSLPIAGVEKEDSLFSKKNESFDITPPDTRIVIPKIAKNIPILTVGEDSRISENWEKLESDIQKALRDGVVHYPGTAVPGDFGNTFITGHSSYYPWDDGRYKDVFAALHNLEEGDEYYIFHKGKKYKYVITEIKVVPPSDVSVLDQNYNYKESTLMTCTPVGTAKNRLILKAEQVGSGY
jgi:LPXTG-site transpeptidase (sortase) family protein